MSTAVSSLPVDDEPGSPALQRVRRQTVPRRAPVVTEPAARQDLRGRFPARRSGAVWSATTASAHEVCVRLQAQGFYGDDPGQQGKRRRAVQTVLTWLADQTGDTWQQRWQASGAPLNPDAHQWIATPMDWWAPRRKTGPGLRNALQDGLLILICADVLRPDLEWLHARASAHLRPAMARHRDRQGFATLAELADTRRLPAPVTSAVLGKVALLLAAHGGAVANITVGDVLELTRIDDRRSAVLFDLLRDAGVFGPDAPATIRVFGRAAGQLSVTELVDQRGIEDSDVRALLIDYLTELAPGLDYSSLRGYAQILGDVFWRDLEIHHPGINSLNLPPDVVAAWKRRAGETVRTTRAPDGTLVHTAVPRKGYKTVLIRVRAFYLDIAQWAIEDPGRWARWAAPCPIRGSEADRTKQNLQQKSEKDQRTRAQVPVLPLLVAAVENRRTHTAALLATASAIPQGHGFTHGGQVLTRADSPHADNIRLADPQRVRGRDLNREENDAFWAWAVVEVLRHTGIRVEELLELTHHAIVQYRLPTTGEVVPLLQITPSKTDRERMLLIGPDLADVLAAIVARIRRDDGTIPQIPSYDGNEKLWRPPLPLLFQHRLGHEDRPFNRNLVVRLLAETTDTLGLPAADRADVTFKPHDFRRIFITDAIANGLPPHIAQMIVGHQDLATTLGYKAIYPTESIEAHRAFLARRRSLRPTEEYRTPTDAEWEEFLGHFQRRKVSVGTCARAYGTGCQHEHACIRCPMLRPEPEHRPRLAEIRDNLTDRIAEAEQEGWLGETEGLTVSLAAAEDKLSQLDRTAARRAVMLGMPTIGDVAGRRITPSDPSDS